MLFGFLAVILMTVFVSVLRAGPGEVSYWRRRNYNLKSWATGSVLRVERGATMHEYDGMEVKASGGTIAHVRQTRAPSSEKI